MNSNIFEKNTKYIIFIAIILLLPAVFAVYFGLNAGDEGGVPQKIESVSVTSPSGEVSLVTGKEHLDIYKSVILNAEPISEKYRDISGETPYVISFSEEGGSTADYSFYLKNEKDECIYVDPNGDYYLIYENDALKLLDMDTYKSVNPVSAFPTAAAGVNGVLLYPTGGSWNFLNADDKYETASPSGSSNTVPVKINANSVGSLSFGTSVYPDEVTVTLSKNGEEKHRGPYENMLNVSVMSAIDTYYDMTITAKWEKKDGAEYYGELSYNVQLLYDVSPTYTVIFNGSIIRGDFGIVKIQNFNDGDKLYVTSDYPFPTEIQVFRSPLGYSFAFLPAQYGVSGSSGKHTVTFSLEDGSSQSVSVNIKDRRTPSVTEQKMLIADVSLALQTTSEAMTAGFEEFNTLAAEKTASTGKTPLWDGKFVYPNSTNKGTVGSGMADYGTARSDVAGQFSYIHNGVDLAMNDGESVYASNSGTVVFAGELALTGNTVIIDHGCSILTYYGHLGTISVSEGDSVSKSGIIGTAGSTGFAVADTGSSFIKTTQVHFAVSVEGVFITPYYLWYGGVDFDD